MKNYISYALCFVLLIIGFSCSKEEVSNMIPEIEEAMFEQTDPLTIPEINQIIKDEIKSTGDFDWSASSELVLWSALLHSEGVLTIGYGADQDDFVIDNSSKQLSSKNVIVDLVRELEGERISSTDKEEDILIFEDEYLTVLDMRVLERETITALRKNKNIRYLEPSGYPFSRGETEKTALSSSGCNFDTEDISAEDYRIITPNARLPWNFSLHNIDDAWLYSTGRDITIGIVDTGLSPNQSLLNSNFNSGYSSGRTIEKYGVYVDSYWPWSSKTDGVNDKCGHGTSMSAAAAAPRNTSGLPVGVAYNSNLITYRASEDVLLNRYHEQRGVARAITELGRRADVKIISMSMGYVYSVSRISDAIKYAYSQDKLIFCAGGTSTSFTNFVGVIFPASMSETVAVTGIEEGSGYDECDTCHKGSRIDFTIVMERSNNNHIPTLGYYDDSNDYVGGSSVATASAAGIAALVWSRNQDLSRDDVLNKLILSADLYPNRNGNYGWGNLDALQAVQ